VQLEMQGTWRASRWNDFEQAPATTSTFISESLQSQHWHGKSFFFFELE
jgi:hypothetical protein